jgi:hypothetical protein
MARSHQGRLEFLPECPEHPGSHVVLDGFTTARWGDKHRRRRAVIDLAGPGLMNPGLNQTTCCLRALTRRAATNVRASPSTSRKSAPSNHSLVSVCHVDVT